MKATLHAVVLTALLAMASTVAIHAQESSGEKPDFDSAVKILQTTKFTSSHVVESMQDPAAKRQLQKTFASQQEAIATISASGKTVDLQILFPYLRLTTDVAHLAGVSPTTVPINVQDEIKASRVRFPVFALIMDMPGAAGELEKYARDPANQIDSRLDAYTILAYLDAPKAKQVAKILRNAITGGTSLLAATQPALSYIDGVEGNKSGYGFDGGCQFR